MIWQFGEIGYDISIDDPCRLCEKPILWEYLDIHDRVKLYKYYQTFINLKKQYEAFSTDNFSLDLSGNLKQIKLYHPSMDVVIYGNFNVMQQNGNPDLSSQTTWYDYYTQEVYDDNSSFLMDPGEYKIFTSVMLDLPDFPNEIKDLSRDALSITPNFTEDFISIENLSDYDLIQIHDMLGNVVLEKIPGLSDRIDISRLRAGFYIVKAVKSDRISTGKILKL
jgi:hypothetical protein